MATANSQPDKHPTTTTTTTDAETVLLRRTVSLGHRRDAARKRQSTPVVMASLVNRQSAINIEHIQDGDRQLSCGHVFGDVMRDAAGCDDVTWRDLINVQRLEVEEASAEFVTSLSQRARQLSRLESLTVTWTPMKTVPVSWIKTMLQVVKSLSLTRNQLRSVDGLESCHQLQQLDLSSNLITSLPKHFGRSLDRLTSLNLTGNGLRNLPDSIGRIVALQSLHCGGNRLTRLPGTICQVTSLRCLDVSGNLLTSLPENIGQMSNLHDLRLSGNKLTDVPASFARLNQLQSLLIANNHLARIPIELSALTNLKLLNASVNNITTMDCVLPAIQTLILDNNAFQSIPRGILKSTSLQMLSMERNQLHEVPDEIRQLTSLRTLSVAGNDDISVVPDSVGELQTLRHFKLLKTRVLSLPASVAQQRRRTFIELNDAEETNQRDVDNSREYQLE